MSTHTYALPLTRAEHEALLVRWHEIQGYYEEAPSFATVVLRALEAYARQLSERTGAGDCPGCGLPRCEALRLARRVQAPRETTNWRCGVCGGTAWSER